MVRTKVVKTYKLNIYQVLNFMFNPIQGGGKRPPTSFSPVTSTNIGISP